MEKFCFLNWETIERAVHRESTTASWYFLSTQRAAVPGGWLVRTLVSETRVEILPDPVGGQDLGVGVGQGAGLTFMPDPDHAWTLPPAPPR